MAQKQNPTEELTMNIRYIYVYMLVKIERCYPKQIKMGLLPSCVYIYIRLFSCEDSEEENHDNIVVLVRMICILK